MDSFSSCRPGRGVPRRGPRAGSPTVPRSAPGHPAADRPVPVRRAAAGGRS
jgi:hypothetical protein